MPEVIKRTINERKKPANDPTARKQSTAATPRAIATKFQNVTLAPPILSESQPPNGRDNEPTIGPRATSHTAENSGNWLLTRTGKLAEKPIKEPKVPMYR